MEVTTSEIHQQKHTPFLPFYCWIYRRLKILIAIVPFDDQYYFTLVINHI